MTLLFWTVTMLRGRATSSRAYVRSFGFRSGVQLVTGQAAIGAGGAAAVASATVSVHVDIPRRKSKLLSLNYVAFAAAVGSAAITITAVKRTNTGTPGNVAQTAAQDITAGAITTLDKAYSVPITATDSNAIFQIGDTLRVDIICAGTVTTQPQGKVVAEWAVLA
jgi:hypothetical protein